MFSKNFIQLFAILINFILIANILSMEKFNKVLTKKKLSSQPPSNTSPQNSSYQLTFDAEDLKLYKPSTSIYSFITLSKALRAHKKPSPDQQVITINLQDSSYMTPTPTPKNMKTTLLHILIQHDFKEAKDKKELILSEYLAHHLKEEDSIDYLNDENHTPFFYAIKSLNLKLIESLIPYNPKLKYHETYDDLLTFATKTADFANKDHREILNLLQDYNGQICISDLLKG